MHGTDLHISRFVVRTNVPPERPVYPDALGDADWQAGASDLEDELVDILHECGGLSEPGTDSYDKAVARLRDYYGRFVAGAIREHRRRRE